MRRVVVTGMGAVTPLGDGVEVSWRKLLAGQPAPRQISRFDASGWACRIAAQVPDADEPDGFDVNRYLPPREQRKLDPFVVLGIAAARQAVRDAGLDDLSDSERERAGVLVGSGIGGLGTIASVCDTLRERGPRRVSPHFIPAALINIISGHISIEHNFRGPCHSVVTACATGAHAIMDSARLIRCNEADIMIAGGTEAAINRVGVAGFMALRALSTRYNDSPGEASRPWDEGRDGFVIGEGAGILVLEEYERARKRGARIYGEISGYGLSGDAHHVTAPPEDGEGGRLAMTSAIRSAGIAPGEIGYINAHGTSTPQGDHAEIVAIRNAIGPDARKIPVSSTKSSIGHLLGASGAVEAIFCLLALRDGVVPPTLNLHNPSEGCDLDLVPLQAREVRGLRHTLSNSFGFGGANACLVMSAAP